MRLIILLLVFISSANYAYATDGKYQDLFYPNGMPVKEGGLGSGPTAYHFYDEAEIEASNGNLLFVLFSEEIITSDPDRQFTAFLAVINENNSALSILNIYDVTKNLVFGSELSDLDGVLNIFSDNVNLLELSIMGRISGSGGMLSSTDVFFLINGSDNSLTPILKLSNTAVFARSGVSKSKYSYTSIYTLINETGMQIFTQKYDYEKDEENNIDQGILSPDINVYQYDSAKKKYSLINTISQLPPGVSEIQRVVKFNTECTTGCNQ